jgi:hypothetical protein
MMTNVTGCRTIRVTLFSLVLGLTVWVKIVIAVESDSIPSSLPADAVLVDKFGSDVVTVYRRERTLWLVLDPKVVEREWVEIPRLCASIRSLGWKDRPDHALEIVPGPQRWRFAWTTVPSFTPVIEVNFDGLPVLPSESPVAMPNGDGSVMLHAYQVETYGEKLRFEPQPHKNTVGYWTVPTDYAVWQLNIDQPGVFAVTLLQGCGSGQGGSEALLTLRQDEQVLAELTFQTVDTGHFQNFRWIHVGAFHVHEAGRYQLRIDPKRIAGAARFDIRAIHLIQQAKDVD